MKEGNDIPANIGKPAQRALASAGITNLEQLAKVTEKELLKLHGMGHKAIGIIHEAHLDQGKSFAAR